MMASGISYVSVPAAGRALGRSPASLRRWVERGLIPAVTLPSGQTVIPTTALDELLETAGLSAEEVVQPRQVMPRGWARGS